MTSSKLQIELDRYIANTGNSRALQTRASKYLPGGSTRAAQYFAPHPIFVDTIGPNDAGSISIIHIGGTHA